MSFLVFAAFMVTAIFDSTSFQTLEKGIK